MTNLAVAERLFAALAAKDADVALACFSADAVVESPMGREVGRDQILAGIRRIFEMPAITSPVLRSEGERVLGSGQSPMGPVKMTFEFSGGLITKQVVAPG
jgi:ketosteroid isomerase-like protein